MRATKNRILLCGFWIETRVTLATAFGVGIGFGISHYFGRRQAWIGVSIGPLTVVVEVERDFLKGDRHETA